MGKRFASVWDALPPGLRDSMPLQSDAELESALHDAATALACKHGFALVHTVHGYRLAGHGRVMHFGLIEDAAKAVRRFTKAPPMPFAGAGGATAHDLPENALQAVWRAWSIASINWTDAIENATCACCMDGMELSNEK